MMRWEVRSFGKGAGAPLLFARDTIVIAVHLDVGAVSQEEGGFSTRSHLRAVGTTIAVKGRRSNLIARLRGHRGLRSYAARVFAVTVQAQGHNDDKRNGSTKEARLLAAAPGHRLATRMYRGTARAKQVLGTLLPDTVGLNFKRESLSDRWAATIFRERRDMNKDLRATLSRCDESEAAIIVPLCESAFGAHMKGLT